MPGAGWPSSADNVVGGPCVRRALAKAGSLFRSVDRGFQALRKCRDLEELVCVETTFLTSSSPFTEPAREGGSQLNEKANPFELAIDIFQCRKQHIRPLDLGEGASDYEDEPLQSQTADLEFGETPAFQDEVTTESTPAKPTDRIATWKRRSLDLTPRNKMLNFKVGSTSIELECPDPIKLEDRLSKGQKSVMVVGDGAQSIYSWRGANYQNILDSPKRYPAARIYRIETNYRSVPEIVALANAAILENRKQFPKTLRAQELFEEWWVG
jgi:hypothetical protein